MHGRDGPYLMEKSKWPTLSLLEDKGPVEDLTQEEALLSLGQQNSGKGGHHTQSQGVAEVVPEETSVTKSMEHQKKDSSTGVDLTNEFDGEDLTQEETLVNMGFMTSGDEHSLEDSQHTWKISCSKKQNKKKKGSKVIIATRASSRNSKDGRTMLEKAMQRAQLKDEATKGNSTN